MEGAGEATGRCMEDLNVSKNVTLTTGRAISGEQPHVKRKSSQKMPITHSLKANLLSLNKRSKLRDTNTTLVQDIPHIFQLNRLKDL